VSAYIVSAYWFTASTSFANPAVTVAPSLTNTFAGIRPADTLGFIVAQLAGAAVAASLFHWLIPPPQPRATPPAGAPHTPATIGAIAGETR
jgi:glycerol uptake facilitator-like aquaporin